jgi:N-methylhydantoinase A
MLESGPAAGVIGAQAICAQSGMPDSIAFDMGGTTAKAGVISEGRPLTTGSALIGGYEKALPIQIPMMDIFEVGTGGGSIARVELGNSLRVGPKSAGSMPGPVCYGREGTEPTVTDANLILDVWTSTTSWGVKCHSTWREPSRPWKRRLPNHWVWMPQKQQTEF